MVVSSFNGVSVSCGNVQGKLFILGYRDYRINNNTIAENEIEDQITNLEVAICRSLVEICDLNEGFKGVLNEQERRIFDAYNTILDDRYFIDEIKDTIRNNRCYADNAIDICFKKYIKFLEEGDNDYALQRISDFNDICTRLIRNVVGEKELKLDEINSKNIVVVYELTPSLAALLAKKKVLGIIAHEGAGYISHSAIILRSFGIPTINGINYDEVKKYNNRYATIDGMRGILSILSEDDCTLNFDANGSDIDENVSAGISIGLKGENKITISANISNIEEFRTAKSKCLDGVGLVRTEMLYIECRKIPSERRQYLFYSKIVKTMKNKPVIIRTADLGHDKMPRGLYTGKILRDGGLRGIERSLAQKEQFLTQIRALMRASLFGNVGIAFPMVTSVSQIIEAKNLIEGLKDEFCKQGGISFGEFKIGAFVETQSAVDSIDDILSEVDFISLGTNDLLQDVMGFDREYCSGDKSEYFHPKFLNVVQYCINKAVKWNKNVSVCGEMASDPLAAMVLYGMGVNDLSMSPSYSDYISEIVYKIDFESARSVVENMLKCREIEDATEILLNWINNRKW